MSNKQTERTVDEIVEEFKTKGGAFVEDDYGWDGEDEVYMPNVDNDAAVKWLTQTLQAERQKRDEVVAEVRDEERRICKAKNLGKVRMFHPTQEAIDEVLTEPTPLTNDKASV